jgi:hypothetical protein
MIAVREAGSAQVKIPDALRLPLQHRRSELPPAVGPYLCHLFGIPHLPNVTLSPLRFRG